MMMSTDEHGSGERHVNTATADHITIRSAYKITITITCLVGLLLPVTIYAYARLAGSWVDAAGNGVGEWVAEEALSQAAAGNTDEAIRLYRRALTVPFADPKRRVQRAMDLAQLLVEAKRPEEAIQTVAEIYASDSTAAETAFRKGQAAMLASGQAESALKNAAWWTEWAARKGSARAASLGKISQAQACAAMHDGDRAAELALDAFSTDPSIEVAIAGARLLKDTPRKQEALPLLDYVIAHDQGSARKEAVEIKAGIGGPP